MKSWAGAHAVSRDGVVLRECKLCGIGYLLSDCPDFSEEERRVLEKTPGPTLPASTSCALQKLAE